MAQAHADRLYLGETVKIKFDLVQKMKKMNSTYPKTSADYDEEFLFHLIKGIFAREEIIATNKTQKLTSLKKDQLKFLKCNYNNAFVANIIRNNNIPFFSTVFGAGSANRQRRISRTNFT